MSDLKGARRAGPVGRRGRSMQGHSRAGVCSWGQAELANSGPRALEQLLWQEMAVVDPAG
jgi:hypothetical protein